MRATKALKCQYGCEFVQVTDRLWLCRHTSYGSASHDPYAVADGRRLLEAAGGYDAALARVHASHEYAQDTLL